MKKTVMITGILGLSFLLTACQGTDVVAKYAVSSFETITKSIPEPIRTDAVNNGWSLKSPNGERFVWSKDFSQEAKPDLMMEFDAKPFIDAGLAMDKLDKNTYEFDKVNNKLMIHSEIGKDKFNSGTEISPLDTFKEIVRTHRSIIGYHEKLDHYGVAFGNGNMFEWAKDIKINDKDIVFVLNPQPLIEAGIDPSKVNGWIFAKIEVKDDKGNKELVDKLLKPYNLK